MENFWGVVSFKQLRKKKFINSASVSSIRSVSSVSVQAVNKISFKKKKIENKNATRDRKKNTNLQKMNVGRILNWNLNFLGIFRKPLTSKSTRRIDIDFERVSIDCALVRFTKIENVYFWSGGKPISHSSLRDIGFFRVKFNVEFTRQAVNFTIKLKRISPKHSFW